MSDLVRAEFLRLVSRRVMWILLAGAVVVAALVAVSASSGTRPLDAEDHAHAQLQADEANASNVQYCKDFPEDCPDHEFVAADFLRQPLDYEPYIRGVADGGLLFVAFGAVLAAALIGGEFRSGSISTQLTFTPRRTPLMAAKLLAATTGAVSLTAVYFTTGTVIGTISFLMVRGAGDLTATAAMPLIMLRMLLAALLVSALAAALTFVVGSTLLAVGLGLLAVVVSEILSFDPYSFVSAWLWLLPMPNLMTILYTDYEYTRYDPVLMEHVPVVAMGFGQAVVYGVVLVLVTAVVGAIVFRRRDLLR